jgi:hypothetical protein
MGRSKTWSSEERRALAIAWVNATNNSIQGNGQRSETYNAKVFDNFRLLTPSGADPGLYHGRGEKAVKGYLTGLMADVQKFNKALRIVDVSGVSGVTLDQKTNMAVAINLNRTSKADYRYKDFNPRTWLSFEAWKVFKVTAKFQPPASITPLQSSTPAAAVLPTNPPPLTITITTPQGGNAPNEEDDILDGDVRDIGTLDAGESGNEESVPPPQSSHQKDSSSQSKGSHSSYSSGKSDEKVAIMEAKLLEEANDGSNRRGGKGRDASKRRLKDDNRHNERMAEALEQSNAQKARLTKMMEMQMILNLSKDTDPALHASTQQALLSMVMGGDGQSNNNNNN